MELFEDGDDRGSDAMWWTFAVLNNPDIIPDGQALGDTFWFDWQGKDEVEKNYYWPSTGKWDYANPNDLTAPNSYNDIIYLRLADIAYLDSVVIHNLYPIDTHLDPVRVDPPNGPALPDLVFFPF